MDSVELTVFRTYDKDLVVSVCANPEILASISEDDYTIDDYLPDVAKDCWLAIYAASGLVGTYKLEAKNSCTIEGHVHILPEMRKMYANSTIIAVYRWILENCPTKYVKFTVEIPEIYPNVIHFVKNAGFQEEGINRKSYRKHGLIVDQIMLGITREEIADFLQGRISSMPVDYAAGGT